MEQTNTPNLVIPVMFSLTNLQNPLCIPRTIGHGEVHTAQGSAENPLCKKL